MCRLEIVGAVSRSVAHVVTNAENSVIKFAFI